MSLDKVLLVFEAILSSFYVVITRNFAFLIPIAIGRKIRAIIDMVLATAILSTIVSHLTYTRPRILITNFRVKFFLVYILERIFWIILPYVAWNYTLFITTYMVANTIAFLTAILFTLMLFNMFSEVELGKILSLRFVFGALTTIIGVIYAYLILSKGLSIELLKLLYLTSGIAGLSSTVTLLLCRIPKNVVEVFKVEVPEVVEVSRVNIFTFLILAIASLNITTLVSLNMLSRNTQLMTQGLVFYAIGTILGSCLWTSIRKLRFGLIILLCTPIILSLIHYSYSPQIVLLLLSSIFTGITIVITQVMSRHVQVFGYVKCSSLVIGSSSVALLLSSLIVKFIKDMVILLTTSFTISTFALITYLFAIPETAVTPLEKVLRTGRVVYTIGTISYNFAIMFTRETLMLFLRALAITVLILLLYVIYRVLTYLIYMT